MQSKQLKPKRNKTNAERCQKYRQKVQLKRLKNKRFDKKFRKKESTRKAKYREKVRQQQHEEDIIPSASTAVASRSSLRKIEGQQRRRQNTAKLKSEKEKLQDSNKNLENINKTLENENKKLKEPLASLTLLSSPQTIADGQTVTSTSSSSGSSNILLDNISPASKKRAAARIRMDKEDLPRGAVKQIRKEFGINVCYWSFDYLL